MYLVLVDLFKVLPHRPKIWQIDTRQITKRYQNLIKYKYKTWKFLFCVQHVFICFTQNTQLVKHLSKLQNNGHFTLRDKFVSAQICGEWDCLRFWAVTSALLNQRSCMLLWPSSKSVAFLMTILVLFRGPLKKEAKTFKSSLMIVC